MRAFLYTVAEFLTILSIILAFVGLAVFAQPEIRNNRTNMTEPDPNEAEFCELLETITAEEYQLDAIDAAASEEE